MNKQLILSLAAAVPPSPSRFDLRSTGLSEAQLKAIAGARMADKTGNPTSPPMTKCCWGV
jgi:hypothetical protein